MFLILDYYVIYYGLILIKMYKVGLIMKEELVMFSVKKLYKFFSKSMSLISYAGHIRYFFFN